MEITSRSCADFVAVLATKAPVPGGGGASALCGAIGTALGNMVGSLTAGKKKYAAVENEIREYQARCDTLQNELLALVEKDAEVFAPLAAAYGLPKDTEEQRAHKEQVMESALTSACEVPLQIMEKCGEALELLAQFTQKGSKIAVSDAGVGAALCRGALQGAALNVYINTKSMKNRERAAAANARADAMLEKYSALADKIYSSVSQELHPCPRA